MAYTADQEYKTMGETEIIAILAGAADLLYKGGLMNIGTDGYIKVAADVANEVTLGVLKRYVNSLGSNVEWCEIERGIIRCVHSGAAQGDIGALFWASADDTLADSAVNVKAAGMCLAFDTGYVWIDFRMKTLGA